MADWNAENATAHTDKGRKLIPPQLAAKRIGRAHWKLSALQDHAFRQSMGGSMSAA